jgi:DNA-binding response OmpR family regulator
VPAQLQGGLVLVVEDEALIAVDIAENLNKVGAKVIIAHVLEDALAKAELPNLAAAVIDHALEGRSTSDVCAKLKDRNIPFIVYTGFNKLEGACASGELVHKPATPQLLVATLQGALTNHHRGIN